MAFEKLVNGFFFPKVETCLYGKLMVAPLLNCVVTQNRKEAACVQENSYNLTNIVLSKDKLFFAIEVTLKLKPKLIAVL